MIDEEFLMCLKSEGSHHVPEVKARDAMLDAIAAKLATIDEVRAVPKSQEIEFINILAEERARPQREPACKGGIWVYERTPPDVKDPERRYGEWMGRPWGKGLMEYVPRSELDAAREMLERMAEALREIAPVLDRLARERFDTGIQTTDVAELHGNARAVIAEYEQITAGKSARFGTGAGASFLMTVCSTPAPQTPS
jgi:hypothetical protein